MSAAKKLRLICINNKADTVTRYIDGKREQRYEITDRPEFNRACTQRTIEQLRKEGKQ